MAPHSSTLAWKIPRMEEPGGLQSMGSLRVGHDWATSLSLFTFMHWRRKWQPTPVSLPGESQGRGSLVGCRLWGRTVGHDWSDLAVGLGKISKVGWDTGRSTSFGCRIPWLWKPWTFPAATYLFVATLSVQFIISKKKVSQAHSFSPHHNPVPLTSWKWELSSLHRA